jgi:hypothetical protein
MIHGDGGEADVSFTARHLPIIHADGRPALPSQPRPKPASRSPTQRGADSRDQGDFGERWVALMAAAAGLGCSTEQVERSIGELGVTYPHRVGLLNDWEIKAQVKTVAEPRYGPDHIAYDLDAMAHRRLTGPSQVPKFLFLVTVCGDRGRWIRTTGTADVLNHGAYWLSLRDQEPTANRSSQVVHVPLRNRLSPDSLRELCLTTANAFLRTLGVSR